MVSPRPYLRSGDVVALRDYFPADRVEWLDAFARYTSNHGTPSCLVGGSVRDLLLEPSPRDSSRSGEFDLMVEGDPAPLLSRLMIDWEATFQNLAAPVKLIRFPRYRTAKLVFDKPLFDRFEIDVASARRETYSSPGAAPDVIAGTIEEDLHRRDFACNAIAFQLLGDGTAKVLDPHRGIEDLKRKELRILHSASFQDDPMRILRAARFMARLTFALEADTEQRLHAAIADDVITSVSRGRTGAEFWKLLEESNKLGANGTAQRAACLLAEWGALGQVLTELGDINAYALSSRILAAKNGSEPASLFAALFEFDKPQAVSAAQRLGYSRARIREIEGFCHLKVQ